MGFSLILGDYMGLHIYNNIYIYVGLYGIKILMGHSNGDEIYGSIWCKYIPWLILWLWNMGYGVIIHEKML